MASIGYVAVATCTWRCARVDKSAGTLSEMMGELDSATQAYERALSFNNMSVSAMLAISCILRSKDQFPAAVEYLRQILRIEHNNGEVWSSLGLFYLFVLAFHSSH